MGLLVLLVLLVLLLTSLSRKTRCSGKYPCAVCSRLRLQCKYTASYRRGRLPSIEMDTEETANAPRATEQQLSGAAIRDQTRVHQPDEHIPSPVSIEHQALEPPKGPRGISTTLSSRNSPEPAQVDLQGHYVGPASGASFLLRIQRKLKQQGPTTPSDSSIFTFGDLPLPQFDPRFLILPPRSEADSLLCRYFEFASATHRFLHRPTVETWLQELYDTHGTMQEQSAARSRTAVLFMVFAHAENFPKSKAGTVLPTTRSEPHCMVYVTISNYIYAVHASFPPLKTSCLLKKAPSVSPVFRRDWHSASISYLIHDSTTAGVCLGLPLI